jgi:Arc-like DNA binding domain
VLLENRMSKKPSQIVQVKVRMREDLRRKIEHAAQKNGLTVNAEILRRLDQTFDVTLDKLEGSVATLSSRFEEQAVEQARREELRHRLMEQAVERAVERAIREETQAVERAIREETQRRLTEAGEKDKGDQS